MSSSQSLSWSERPLRELIRLSWPIAVSMVSYSLMTLVDTVFVAGLGRAELAAVGLGGVATFTLFCFSIGLLRGVKVLVSQAIGADRPADAADYRAAGLVLGVALGLFTVAFGVALSPLIAGLAASGDVGGHAAAYMAIRMTAAPLLLAFVALREARYGRGDARTPMLAAVTANLLNVGLDALLIFGLDGGVAGAAWASVAATAWQALVLLWATRDEPWPGVRAGCRQLGALWRIGLPTGIQFLLEVGSFSMLAAILATMPEVEMAAHQLVLQAIHLSFLPALAIGEAGSVLAGQAIGARRDELVGRVARAALAVAGGYTAACTVAFTLAGPVLLARLLDDAELVATATGLLYVSALFQVADGANVVARGILRGTGDVRFPAIVGVVTAWVCAPPLAWLLGVEAGLGARGAWLGLCLEIFIGAAVFWHRLVGQKWLPAAELTRAEVASRPLEAAGA